MSSLFHSVTYISKHRAHLKHTNFSYPNYRRKMMEMFLNTNKTFQRKRGRKNSKDVLNNGSSSGVGVPTSAFHPHRNCCLITSSTCCYMLWGVVHNNGLMTSQLWHRTCGQLQAHFSASSWHLLKVTVNLKPPLHVGRRNSTNRVKTHWPPSAELLGAS